MNKRYLLVFFSLTGFYYCFSQNVGIGATIPAAKLHIKGTADTTQLVIDANSVQQNKHPLIRLRNSSGTDLLWIHSDDSSNIFLGYKAGRVNVASAGGGYENTFVGKSAGFFNSSGFSNTITGSSAFFSNTTGNDNSAYGCQSLYSNTIGVSNTAAGRACLYSNTTGNFNTATGTTALYHNTDGSRNTANGTWALFSNTNGHDNTGLGGLALFNNTTANFTSAVGCYSMYSNTTGDANVAMGYQSLYSNTTGYENTATGYQSLINNITGVRNMAAGSQSLLSNSTGSDNTAMGNKSQYSNTIGFDNTATGRQSLYSNTTGSGNTAYGAVALYLNVSGFNNTAIGYNAGCNGSTNPFNFTALGNSAGHVGSGSNTVEIGNTLVTWNGGNVGWSTYSDARIKSDVREEVPGLSFITRLRPVIYHRNCKAIEKITGIKDSLDYPGKYDIEKIKFSGFLAQEVEAAAKAAGYDFSGITAPKNDKQIYSLCYEQFVVPLVKAVQELSEQNDRLKIENVQQKKQMSELLARVEKIESLYNKTK